MVELEGKILKKTKSILIDPGASLNYVTPRVVENFCLQAVKFKNPWLVQMATRAKQRVLAKINDCQIELARHPIKLDLNIFPLDPMMP